MSWYKKGRAVCNPAFFIAMILFHSSVILRS